MKGEEGVEYKQKWERTISIEITTHGNNMPKRLDLVFHALLSRLHSSDVNSSPRPSSGKWDVLELTITTGNYHLVRGPCSLVHL